MTPGKRYRFRLVSLSCDPNFLFSIDGHDLTIIETDSVNTEPLVVDSIQIFAGQRYSFILEANQSVNNYWIRANPNIGNTGYLGGLNSAILRYDGAPETEPTSLSVSTKPLKETALHPLTPMPVVSLLQSLWGVKQYLTNHSLQPGSAESGGVDKAINFVFSFVRTMRHAGKIDMLMHSLERHELLRERSHFRTAESSRAAADHERSTGGLGSSPVRRCLRPSLECDYRVVLPGHDKCPWCAASLPFARGKPIAVHFTRRRVELTGWQQHTFAVVRSAGSSEYNYDNPIWRDVVSTGIPTAGDNVTIRFRVSDIITLRNEYIS